MAFETNDRSRWLATHVLPHEPALRSWLRRFGPLSFADIDDLIQETYAILATKESVIGIVDPRAYAFQVAKSVFLQNLRRAKVVSIDSLTDLVGLAGATDDPSPERHAAGRAELQRVTDAIRAMPPQTLRAFWLRRVDGLPQREVASVLNISENTVEKHITRGIRLLMEQFGRGGKAGLQTSSNVDHAPQRELSVTNDPSRARNDYR